MINLMPESDQKELTAARTNSLLLRYIILTGFFIALLVIELFIVYAVINNDKKNNEATIAENQAKTTDYQSTKQEAANFQTNLATAKFMLSQRTPYTKIILALANGLPSGAVIDQLTLDPTTFDTPTTLSVRAVSYEEAINVKNALQAIQASGIPIFSSVSFSALSNNESSGAYPYTATYNITYSKAVLR